MSKNSQVSEGRPVPRKYLTPGPAAAALLCFILLGSLAWFICSQLVQSSSRQILGQHQELEQIWLDKGIDGILAWRQKLLEQAGLISASEMLRLFVRDARALSREELEILPLPAALHSADDYLRSMAEQLAYIKALLQDFTSRRALTDASILLPDGKTLAASGFRYAPSEDQLELIREAAQTGQPLFGPVRHEGNRLLMDMAVPMLNLPERTDSAPIAVLLLTVPMEEPLAGFLASKGGEGANLLSRLVDSDKGILYLLLSREGAISMEPVHNGLKSLAELPFGRRAALDGRAEVYSMASPVKNMEWLFAAEMPADRIEALINARKVQLYALGALASLVLTMFASCFWNGRSRHKRQADAEKFENLYKTIQEQKMVLDSINASFNGGLVLVDSNGLVQLSNPAFGELCGKKSEQEKGTPLREILPEQVALKILGDIKQVCDAEKSASDEIRLPGVNPSGLEEERLYRVTFYPYYSTSGREKRHSNGCVAIFQDITDFRRQSLAEKRKAKKEQKKQEALISAFARAVESVDPNLPGHSDKMAGVARLLSAELQLSPQEAETLELAARLSQVGKIYVPRQLLTKKGKLTAEELAELRKAPEYADKILRELHFELPVRETVAMMGEKVDGSGAPKGLKDREIPITGRALGLVNAFIAMTSPRSWRGGRAMNITEAIGNLRKNPGFDQGIVEALANIPQKLVSDIIGQK